MKNHLKNLYEFLAWLFYKILIVLLDILPVKLYQPLYRSKKENVTRECADRWNVIAPHIGTEPGSVLDIGCNLGFFSFHAAEKNKMVLGVDANPFYQMTCNALRNVHEMRNASFIKSWIDEDFVSRMPAFDIIFHFSVFHHWVKAYGEARAKAMMKQTAAKCQTLFFETGQPDERGTKWADKMAFMGDEPQQWMTSFLSELGFDDIEMIGTFKTGLTQTDRYLFCARKTATK
jgi:SAM-dependent methyltransferase